MKNFILIAIFSFLTYSAFSQVYDNCAGAGGDIDNIASGSMPYTFLGSIPNTFTDDGTYDATASFAAGTYTTGFYAFTVDADGYYDIHFEAGGSATGDLSVGWDPGSGTCPGAQTDVGDITTGFDITSDCIELTAGTTYYISMALENGHEGDFTITIDKGEDVCEGALEEVFQGDNVLDNSCSHKPPSPGTGGTIWTTYTVVPGPGGEVKHLTVDILPVSTGSLDKPYIYQVLLNDCSGDDVSANAICLNAGDVLYIESGNNEPDYGDYTVHIDQGVTDVDNIDCVHAKELEVNETCEWVDFLEENNVDACPDPFIVGACDLNQGPTVWYKVRIPVGADSIDVIVDNTSFGDVDMIISRQADACSYTAGWCGEGGTLDEPIKLTPADYNTWFYIAVTDPAGGGGEYDIHVKIKVPPINDSPCMTDERPPYDLGTVGVHTGTTCCSVGFNDDPDLDKENEECNPVTDDNAVWYRVTYDPTFDGVNININKTNTDGIDGSIGVEVYVGGADAICDESAELRKSKCDGLPVTDMHIGCLHAGDYVFIKVANSDNEGDCGSFDIRVENIHDCDVADECVDITGAQELDPVTPDEVEINKVCTNGCLDLSCPNPGLPEACAGFDSQPTVWYQVNCDANAGQLYTYVTTNGSWTPVWSVFYSPDNDCTDLQNAASMGGVSCSIDASSPTAPPLITGVAAGGVYYIAVSANEGDVIDDPNFEICAATIKNVITCLGGDGCEQDPSLVFEVTARENTEAEPDGPPYNGPFCPGEEVTVHMHFYYDATETGADWMNGIIPKFGSGWDMTDFDFAGNPPTGAPGGIAEWYDENGDCAPLVMDPFPFLCTYADDDGHLRLCNTLCEDCPCSDGMVKWDPLPSGYFWVQEGTSPECDPNDCSPARKWGIGSKQADIDWVINLKVKEYETQEECMDNNNLEISFMTFSDGGAGCWVDPDGECLIIKPQFSPPWKVNCDIPPGVLANPQPRDICSGSEVGIDVSQDDGLATEDIEVTFEDNPNVDGESEQTFSDGFGTINDVLTINDEDICDVQVVTYYAQIIIPDMICEGKVDTIEVNVYPLPRIPEQDEIPGICMDDLLNDSYDLPIEAECGFPGTYEYKWEDDLSGKSGEGDIIPIDESFGAGLHTFHITVTDELGCQNTGDLKFNIYPLVKFKLQGDTLCWGEQKEFTVDLLGRETSDFEFDWGWDPGDGPDGGDETYTIETEEYGSTYTPSAYPDEFQLCLELKEEHDDGVICSHDTCVTVYFRKPRNISLNPGNPVYICEGQNCVDVEVVFDEENGMMFDEVSEISWNGSSTNNPEYQFCETTPGNFVEVTDIYGCDTIIEFDVLANDVTDVEIVGNTSICIDECTTLTVVEDFESYTWNTGVPGDTTKSITVCPTDTSTTYEVSAINSSGCVSTGSVDVHVFTAEVPNIPPTATFCTGHSTTITAPGGYQSYSWYYNNVGGATVSTTQDVVIDKAGDYIIVVVSTEGCTAQDTIVASEASKLTPFVVGDTSLCFEDDKTLMVALGGNFTVYEWRYSASGNLVIPETDKDSIYLEEGVYDLYVSDGNCDGTTSFTITRKPKIEPKINPDVDTVYICYGGDTTLVAPPGYDKYHWSTGTGSFNDTIFNVGSGKYYVTVTDDEGCQGVDSIYVDAYPRMYPSLQDSIEICADANVTLTPGKFEDYIWSKDGSHLASFDGKESIEVNSAGIYSVVVSNAIGCTAFDTIKVVKSDELTPVIVGAEDLCEDDEITLSVSGTYDNYEWTNSSGKVLGTDATLKFTMTSGKDVESVILKVRSNAGCLGSDQVTMNRYHTPELELDHTRIEVCGKGSTNPEVLNFNDYFVKGNATIGKWIDFDNSNANPNADWSVVDFTNVDVDKRYRYVFTTTTAKAPCENVSDTIYVEVKACLCDQWELSLFSDVCNDENSTQINLGEHVVNANGDRIVPVPAGVWTVTPAGTGVLSGNKFIAAGAESGTYTITYKFNDKGNYCKDISTQTITVQNAVNPGTPQPQHVCEGTSDVFDLGGLLLDGDEGGTWTEVSSNLSTGDAFDANAGTFNTNGQKVGEYIFKYSLTGVDPCPDKSVKVSIIVDPTPIADAGDITACFEDKPVTLYAKNEAERYEWTKKGSTDILGTNREYSTSESGTYVLKVLSTLGCSTEKDIVVDIKPQIVVEVTGATVLQNGAIDTLFANVTGRTGDDIRIYNWTKDGELIDSVHSKYLVVSDKGVYCAEVEDNDGCTGEACLTVSVSITKEIEVPNIFSPDGDGKNEKFFVKDGQNIDKIRTFKVWDRWGNLIYSDADFSFGDRKNHFWDGNYNGKKAMQGVYVYLVEFTWSDGKDDFVAGDVTLIR